MALRRILSWVPLAAALALAILAFLRVSAALEAADRLDAMQDDTGRPHPREIDLGPLRLDGEDPIGLHGQWDVRGAVPRLTVILQEGGILLFKGHETSLDEEGPATLREELRRLVDKPAFRRLDGHSEIPVMIAAQRRVACRHVRTLLDVLEEPEIRVDLIQWPLCHPVHGRRFRQDARRLAWNRPDLDAPGLDVRLAAAENEESLAARLQLGARAWWVSMAEEKDEPLAHFFEEQVWTEIAAALEEAANGAKHARILLRPYDDRLAWGHLARLIDALVGAGVGRVTIPSWGLALELDVPPPVDVPEPRSDAAPVLTPGTIVACVLAVLLAFAITFWPWRRGRRRGKA